MTVQSFTAKNLRFTFTLSTGAKFNGPNNTLQLTGLRARVDIDYPGPPSFPTASMRIYGMALADMNALTGLTFNVLSYQRNSVLVEADSGSGFVAVFAGQIITAVPDFDAIPDVALQLTAQTLGFDLLNPATPTSFAVAASFEQVISSIVAKMGRTLVNDGVSGSFSGPVYFGNTPAEQLRRACKKAGILYYLDTGSESALGSGTVVITPNGSPRNLPSFTLTPNNGLEGYPKLQSVVLVSAVSVFNPALRYGAPLTISGSIQAQANGDWMIYSVSHRLSSLLPNGPWFSYLTLQKPAGGSPIVGPVQ